MPMIVVARYGQPCTGHRAEKLCRSASGVLQPSRLASSKRGGSSARYLARQQQDPFVRARVQSTADHPSARFVARSAFKLQQLNDAHRFLRPGKLVVDLGAAPGGWSQVAMMAGCRHVFALDLLPIHPSVVQQGAAKANLTALQGDFRLPDTHRALQSIISEIRGDTVNALCGDESTSVGVDVIISDMMANMSGNAVRDNAASIELLEAAFSFARTALRAAPVSVNEKVDPSSRLPRAQSPSVLVLKYFESTEAQRFRREQLVPNFAQVINKKVRASRAESSEMYFVCVGLKPSKSS